VGQALSPEAVREARAHDQRPARRHPRRDPTSTARVEAINTQIRLITRRAFGFHSANALIALAMLSLADLCPSLPQ
jgi:transposase